MFSSAQEIVQCTSGLPQHLIHVLLGEALLYRIGMAAIQIVTQAMVQPHEQWALQGEFIKSL